MCKGCDKRFEVLVRSSEQEKPVCPVCKKEAERIFSAFGFSKGGKFVSSSSKTSCTGLRGLVKFKINKRR
jgi:putative FmdB family regulatory protein